MNDGPRLTTILDEGFAGNTWPVFRDEGGLGFARNPSRFSNSRITVVTPLCASDVWMMTLKKERIEQV